MHLEALQSLAQSLAAARSLDAVLKQVVQGLGMTPGVALARLWLLEEGDAPHLKLVASVGASVAHPGRLWNQTDGNHARLPLTYGKVGRVARENLPILLQRGVSDWLVHEDWAEEEGIESFAAQPLIAKGRTLGVLAFFSRVRLDKNDLRWLRVYADHAALAVDSARTNEELARLKVIAESERDYLRAALRENQQLGGMVAESPRMQHVLRQVEAVAHSDSPVLVLGESGVGKELVATLVHDLSPRKGGPLVKVNCASIPKELFESEFFGHVRGAFSGAHKDREGRFALANGGTLFLDEVGEIPLPLQAKLLRVLQEKTYEMVGDTRTRTADVRIVAATNRSLEHEVGAGRFREDLYYRLGVLPISVPPLRERREDILPMAERFVTAVARKLNLSAPPLSAEDRMALLDYPYPGNVRELQNIVERALVLGATQRPRTALNVRSQLSGLRPNSEPPREAKKSSPEAASTEEILSDEQVRKLEVNNMRRALTRCNWKIAGESGAARLLGMSPSTLAYRMRQVGLKKPDDAPEFTDETPEKVPSPGNV
jgi:transcriptional regulator with GAF, ATPase, and Fis domain